MFTLGGMRNEKIIITLIKCFIAFTFVGCSGNEKGEKQSVNDELYNKAMAVLDEFKDEAEIKDFLEAYNLLTTLPDDENKFVEQLHEVNSIFSKYGI